MWKRNVTRLKSKNYKDKLREKLFFLNPHLR